jgi:hypothetical protein
MVFLTPTRGQAIAWFFGPGTEDTTPPQMLAHLVDTGICRAVRLGVCTRLHTVCPRKALLS